MFFLISLIGCQARKYIQGANNKSDPLAKGVSGDLTFRWTLVITVPLRVFRCQTEEVRQVKTPCLLSKVFSCQLKDMLTASWYNTF